MFPGFTCTFHLRGHWRFAHLTQFYWSKIPPNMHESSVYIGISVFFLLIYVWNKRKNMQVAGLRLWYFILIFFTIMSLGPVLHIWGKEIAFIKLPYELFTMLFPILKLSGVPVRMMVMTQLSVSILCAIGFKLLFRESTIKRLLAVVLLIILFFEYLPKPIPASQIAIPKYVNILKRLPDNKGIIDTITPRSLALYYQTIHNKPIAFGYIARIPKSVEEKNKKMIQVINNKQYTSLYRDFNI
jgi:hypothetical protein